MHAIRHSIGLAFATDPPAPGSFTVTANGTVREVLGWGRVGPPFDTGHFVNAPPDPHAVHTVALEGDSDEVLAGARRLVEEHLARYSTCQSWVSTGSSRRVQRWVAAGCPPPDVGVPTDEELAAAARTEVPTGDDSFFDESEPVGDEVSMAQVEEDHAADTRARVEAARTKAADERDRLRAELDEAGVPYDGRWGVKTLRDTLEAHHRGGDAKDKPKANWEVDEGPDEEPVEV